MDFDACTLDLVTLAAEERLRAEGQKVPAEQSASQSSTMAVRTSSPQGVRSITSRWGKRSSSSASLLAAPSVPPSMPAAGDVPTLECAECHTTPQPSGPPTGGGLPAPGSVQDAERDAEHDGPADLVDTLESSISESPDSEDYSALSDLELEQRLVFAQYRHSAACAVCGDPCTPEEIRHVAAELEASSALCHQLSTLLAQRRGDP